MLVLSRKAGESIRLGDEITLHITAIKGSRVRVAIEAPRELAITRAELDSRMKEQARFTLKSA